MSIKITTFYKFTKLTEEQVRTAIDTLVSKGEQLSLRGLILVALEGVNGTISAPEKGLEEYKDFLQENFGEMIFKNSSAPKQPFPRFKVKLKPEIVALGDTEIFPTDFESTHLNPAEWNKVLEQEGQQIALIDVRNTYETELGMFKGATDPETASFNQFPEYVQKCGIPKDKKVLMYCTGGIRCEKASLEMKKQGYNNVYQLEGGILKYIEEFPNKHFNGECFVFDHRVAVDQELQPSKTFGLCPHCGDPGDLQIHCKRCSKGGIICSDCSKKEERNTCSKDCRNHYMKKIGKVQGSAVCYSPKS